MVHEIGLSRVLARQGRRVSVKQVHAVRLTNLVRLIEDRFKGNAAAAAKQIRRSHTLVWQLVNKRRSIGEDMARHIEATLGLPYGALDSGLLAPATELHVVNEKGATETYRMIPEVEFTVGLNKKTGVKRPCPAICSGGTVYVIVPTNSLSPRLHKGEQAFIDIEDAALADDKVYAIAAKGVKEPMFRIAQRRDGGGWRFITLDRSGDVIGIERVSVLGRVVQAARDV